MLRFSEPGLFGSSAIALLHKVIETDFLDAAATFASKALILLVHLNCFS